MQRLSLPVQSRPPPAERTHISHSSISTFQACPLRYAFRYVLGLPEETTSSSLVLGRALHASLEFHFSQLLAGSGPPGLDELLGAFWDGWHANEATRIVFSKGEDINSVARQAEQMLRAFSASEFARPRGAIIGVEEEVRAELLPGVPELLARLDLVIDADNELIVTDFKTSRSAWSQEQVQSSAAQVLLYHEAVKPLADGRPVRLQFAVMTKTKVPSLVLHQVPVDLQQITRTKAIVKQVWQAIQGQNFYPVPSPLNCSTCPYRKPCQQWRG